MRSLKNEIKRVQGIQEEAVLIDRQTYLCMLKELKVLRFKVCAKTYWTHEKTDRNTSLGLESWKDSR